jgi:hypothetical protein
MLRITDVVAGVTNVTAFALVVVVVVVAGYCNNNMLPVLPFINTCL